MRVAEGDAEGAAAGLPEAAAGKKAAQPAEAVSQGDVGGHDVGRFPDRKLVPAHIPDADRHCRQQAAVEYEAAFPDGEGVQRVPGELLGNFGDVVSIYAFLSMDALYRIKQP